jgi:DNA-binding transcriptional MerR regulator
MVKLVTGGGSDLSPGMQKIADKLNELLAGGKKLDISIDELKKKAGATDVKNATVSAYINREKAKGKFKKLSIKRFGGGIELGTSKYDDNYNNSKKFRDFYNKTYKTPWKDATNKKNAYDAFLRNKDKLTAKGFNLSEKQMAEKLGISTNTLRTYNTPSRLNLDSTTSDWIKDNIKKIRTIKDGKSVNLYKDLTKTDLKNWTSLQESSKISSAMVDNIKEYDEVFRDQIKKTKKLPELAEVFQETSMKTPATVANTEALYSRLLRGETFRRDVGIAKDVVLGKKIIDELAINSTNNARRSAFYRIALDNINKLYPNESGNLETFKSNFRNELKNILKTKKVPFSVNEVIGLSTGESRGIQPFSVFVDAVDTNINEGELARYQGQFSKKVGSIQKLLSGNTPNVAEAERIALSLDSNRKTLIDSLTRKGFTLDQINQLNLPDIKVGSNVLETYKAKDLSRFKKAGVDIAQFAKDKGFYIDVKKAKPFWESNIRNTIVAAAQNNTGNVCNIFSGKIAFSKDGGRIGFSGGCGKEMAEAMETDRVGTLNKINQTEGILPKFKNAATSFLKNPGIRRFGIAGAVGAAIGAVKEFNNNDPTTYLSDENQQRNMLVDMFTDPITTEMAKPAILDYQLPILGAEAAAVTAAATPKTLKAVKKYNRGLGVEEKPIGNVKTGAKILGRGLAALGTPAALLPMEAMNISRQLSEGDSIKDIATDPLNYLGAAFVGPASTIASRSVNPTVAKILRLGINPRTLRTVSSRFGLPGLALSLGFTAYDKLTD